MFLTEIVHSNVHSWSGQCNKNLGNAFVIVWRIGDEHTLALNAQQTRLRGGATMEGPQSSSQSIKKAFSNGSNNSNGSNELVEPAVLKRKAAQIDLRRVPGVDILGTYTLDLIYMISYTHVSVPCFPASHS